MALYVNRELIGQVDVTSSSLADYAFMLASPTYADEVAVAFINDSMAGGCDHNLYVESITLSSGPLIASTATERVVYDRGEFFDQKDVLPGQQALPINGALRFFLAPRGERQVAYLASFSQQTPVVWSSTTWTGVSNVLSFTDRFNKGITRSGSTLTFAQGGLYRIHFNANGYGYNLYLGLRLRRLSGMATTLLQRVTYSGANRINDQPTGVLSGLFRVSAGDVVDFQYAISGGPTSTWTAINPLDGEIMNTAELEITSVELD